VEIARENWQEKLSLKATEERAGYGPGMEDSRRRYRFSI